MNQEMPTRAPRTPSLSMPGQVAPVDRGAWAGSLAGNGVEADGWFDDIVGGIGKVAQVGLPILSSLGI